MRAAISSRVLSALARDVKTPARVLICYDMDSDDTLPAIRNNSDKYSGLKVELVQQSATRRAFGDHGQVRRQHGADGCRLSRR